MENENKESKNDADNTANQNAPTGEQKPEENKEGTPEVPEEEKVTLSKKEFEDLKKRASDFDRSIELKRLAKLADKETPAAGGEVQEEIAKLREELSSFKAQSFNSNLTEAYRELVKDNPWVNDDAKFDKIKENFATVGTETKDELLSKLKLAAQTSFPQEYEKHLEDKIKAKVLTDKANLNSGGAAGSAEILHKDNKPKTDEDLLKERMAKLYAEQSKTRR